MPELYGILETGFNSLQEFLINFTDFSPAYDAAYVVALKTEASIAESLPDEQARYANAEIFKVRLEKDNQLATDKWQMLKRYITKAYLPEELKARLEEAGQLKYKKAAAQNFEETRALLVAGKNFLDEHSADLLANNNMPPTFQAQFQTIQTNFLGNYTSMNNENESAKVATEEKVKANNAIFEKLMVVFLDGQAIFKYNEPVFDQFVFETVRQNISNRVASISAFIQNITDNEPIEAATITITTSTGPVIITTDITGKASKVIANGIYSIQIDATGFNSIRITDFEVKLGQSNALKQKLTPTA